MLLERRRSRRRAPVSDAGAANGFDDDAQMESHMICRPHWSYSQLAQYFRCPLQYYFERIVKLPRGFIPSGMALGSAVHETLADYHHRLQSGAPIVPAAMRDVFVGAWQRRITDKIQYRAGESLHDLQDQGVALIDAYLDEPPPRNILDIERQFVVPLYNSRGAYLDKPLVAVVDLVCGAEGTVIVVEFKTSGRKYSVADIDAALQARCYLHMARDRYAEPATIRYTVLVKTRTPQVQHLEATPPAENPGRLGDIVQAVEQTIAAGGFYPIETPMNCSSCSYRRECRAWQQSDVTVNPAEAAGC